MQAQSATTGGIDLSTPEAGGRLYERRSYRRPPIIQAICEVRFAPGTDAWNPALPGLLYERLRGDYPATPTQTILSGLEIAPNPQAAAVTFRPPVASVELKDVEGRNVVSMAPDLLVARVTAPYPGWEAFYERISHVVTEYGALAPEARVQRVGLRYVNRVVIPARLLPAEGGVTLTDYFNAAPDTPDDFPQTFIGVVARWESLYSEPGRDLRLIYTFSTVPAEEDAAAFVLDFDVIELWPEPVPLEGISDLTDLKRRETAAFEATITDQTRELIDDAE